MRFICICDKISPIGEKYAYVRVDQPPPSLREHRDNCSAAGDALESESNYNNYPN